ncbi:MAG TPA: hypothetical protein VJT75_13090 [Thermoleophilaceae bacterium]|nr:hypothetical protein [Thermoleophilaceae bacterium]
MRPIRAILPALLTCALLAGCGGSDENEAFGDKFGPVNDQLLVLRSSISQAPPGSDAMLAGEFSGFATQLDETRRRLDTLKPPEELRGKTDALSTALAKLTADLRDIAHAATVHDTPGTRAATQRMVTDLRAAEDARRELARETGVRVGNG